MVLYEIYTVYTRHVIYNKPQELVLYIYGTGPFLAELQRSCTRLMFWCKADRRVRGRMLAYLRSRDSAFSFWPINIMFGRKHYYTII